MDEVLNGGTLSGASEHRLVSRLHSATARHSRFVGMMKLVLPVTAAALIAIILVWPRLCERSDSLGLSFAGLGTGEANSLTMDKPRFIGADAKGRPFMITAEVATQDPTNQRRVTLEALQADMTMDDGHWFSFIAPGGVFDQTGRTLSLSGPVNLFSDQGHELQTGDLAVDLGRGTAVTETPVTGQGPFGSFRADSMKLEKQGRHMYFSGNVKVTIIPGRLR